MKRFLVILGAVIFLFGVTGSASADILFQENFDGSGPGFEAWTIIDYDGDNTWEAADGWGNLVPPYTGYAAAADAWYSWSGMNDVVWSPSISTGGYKDITLTTGVGVVDSAGYEYAAILLLAEDWPVSREWTSWVDEDYTNEAASWDITDFLEGASSFKVGFWFYADSDSYGYFGADNIKVTGNPVPVPAAVWLLGSGLIGLAGVRRKLKAESSNCS